jgi:acetoin utilization deacetylase AcuC-like enzyme
MKFYYSDTFNIPLPEKHKFPGSKYGMLRQELVDQKILSESQLFESPLCSVEDLLLAHSEKYVSEFNEGTLDPQALKRIGFPWSEHLVKRSLATVGGALAAADAALEFGISGQLAGGTHHSHRDYGSGYCVFNDFAVTAFSLIAKKKAQRVAIVDLDVHQGDGNASICSGRDDVFVFSMHGQKNFPFRKFSSDLDIGLPDECGDREYLQNLQLGLESVEAFHPDFILYQAGVDILECDYLGRLKISYEGLDRRDRVVMNWAKSRGIPISMGIGGGYAQPIEQSVKGYVQTYSTAKSIFKF